MLLVRDSMTREVVTVGPETTAPEALALCRDMRSCHLPVVEDGLLIGVISDRDLRSAAPALGEPDWTKALESIRATDEIVREIATARADDPVERAAREMYERKVGCLPVTDGDDLMGIVASSDVMEAYLQLLGAHEPGRRVEVALSGRPGAFAGVAGIFQNRGVDIVSVLVSLASELDQTELRESIAVFRPDTINPQEVVEDLRSAGYRVLWPPAPGEDAGRM